MEKEDGFKTHDEHLQTTGSSGRTIDRWSAGNGPPFKPFFKLVRTDSIFWIQIGPQRGEKNLVRPQPSRTCQRFRHCLSQAPLLPSHDRRASGRIAPAAAVSLKFQSSLTPSA